VDSLGEKEDHWSGMRRLLEFPEIDSLKTLASSNSKTMGGHLWIACS
jgi:hypothetical protein